MSTNLEAKKLIVEEIKNKISSAKSVAFVDYCGLTVDKDFAMRKQFRENGSEYKVYKNRLMLRALNDLGLTGCDKYFEGNTAVAFSNNDEVSGPKILIETAKEATNLKVKFGILDGKVVDGSVVEKIAKIPSKEVLIAQLLSVINGPIRNLAVALDQVAKKEQ